MGNEQDRRKLFWWNMPTDPNKSAEAGGKMMRSLLIWVIVVVVVIAIGVIASSS